MPIPMSAYPKPTFNTGIGWHLSPNGAFPMGEFSSDWPLWVERLKAMGASWVKLIAFGNSALDLCVYLRSQDIMPIVRLYRPAPNPGSMVDDDPGACSAVEQYVSAGCKYFEVNNEPNLFEPEWAGDKNAEGIPVTWQEWNPNQPTPVADSWVRDAKFILDRGGFPGIPAMAPGGNIDDQNFLTRFFDRIISTGNAGIMDSGVWLSVHPAGFNHDLLYPSDAVNQAGLQLTKEEYDKHQWRGDLAYVNAQRTHGKNPGQTLMDPGASNGWRKWEMVETLFEQKFGFKVPVLATEGGFWMNEGQDPRYHILNEWDVSYLTRTTSEAIMNGQYPDWFFCTGYWLIASKGMGGTMAFEHQAAWSPMAPNGNYWPVVDNLGEMVKHQRTPYVDPVIPPTPGWVMTDKEIAELNKETGFKGANWTISVAVVLAESGGRTDAVGYNEWNDSRDRGIFQVQSPLWDALLPTDADAFNPKKNAAAAFIISDNGVNWVPWSAYNSGRYLEFMDRAKVVTVETFLPTLAQLRNIAYWGSMGIPYTPGNALTKKFTELGGVPIGRETTQSCECGLFVGQMGLGPIEGVMTTYLLFCRHGDWGNIYIQTMPGKAREN